MSLPALSKMNKTIIDKKEVYVKYLLLATFVRQLRPYLPHATSLLQGNRPCVRVFLEIRSRKHVSDEDVYGNNFVHKEKSEEEKGRVCAEEKEHVKKYCRRR